MSPMSREDIEYEEPELEDDVRKRKSRHSKNHEITKESARRKNMKELDNNDDETEDKEVGKEFLAQSIKHPDH